jgi:hypothetical protein
MTDLELKLKDYLSKNTSIIEKSLKDMYIKYNCIIVNEIEIDDNYFQAHCTTCKTMPPTISPWFPIPTKFLRKNKLEMLRLYQK